GEHGEAEQGVGEGDGGDRPEVAGVEREAQPAVIRRGRRGRDGGDGGGREGGGLGRPLRNVRSRGRPGGRRGGGGPRGRGPGDRPEVAGVEREAQPAVIRRGRRGRDGGHGVGREVGVLGRPLRSFRSRGRLGGRRVGGAQRGRGRAHGSPVAAARSLRSRAAR